MKRYSGYIVLASGRTTVMDAGAKELRVAVTGEGATVFAAQIDANRAVNQTPWLHPGEFLVLPLKARRVFVVDGRACREQQ